MRTSLVALAVTAAAQSVAGAALVHRSSAASAACAQIQASVSSASSVAYPLTLQYTADNAHYAASSSDTSVCTVEPGSIADVSAVIKIVGQQQVPFAVKGGGHAYNPGWSSTPGVMISMSRFSETTFTPGTTSDDPTGTYAGTARIGAGLIWDDVYAALDQQNVAVLGGRVTGVGVAGYLTGGGYSWKTNRYGLASDTIVAYDFVTPNGTVLNVTEASYPDLFFAIQGGGNNFGIVTTFTLKAYHQTAVYGGFIEFLPGTEAAFIAATANFSTNNTDPKAAIIASFTSVGGLSVLGGLSFFYDAPQAPAGIFDAFLSIPAILKDVKTRSLTSLVQSTPSNMTISRSRGHTVGVKAYSASLLTQIFNQTQFWGTQAVALLNAPGTLSMSAEPFIIPAVSALARPQAAYPHAGRFTQSPFSMYWSWASALDDAYYVSAMQQSAGAVYAQALAEGQDIGSGTEILYNNYALAETPLELLYGPNLPSLHATKQKWDPQNVMGLAGGFKL